MSYEGIREIRLHIEYIKRHSTGMKDSITWFETDNIHRQSSKDEDQTTLCVKMEI